MKQGLLSALSVEPVILMFNFGFVLVSSSQLQTDLLIWKVCSLQFGYNDTVCDNLGDWAEESNEVQREVNAFQMRARWINAAPTFFYALFVGAVTDDVGSKVVILFSLSGFALTVVCDIFGYAFRYTLPLEYAYTEQLSSFFGGRLVYFLGLYSLGARSVEAERRATRLMRMDGADQVAALCASLLAPTVLENTGYYGVYSLRLALILASMVYLVVAVKEPRELKEQQHSSTESISARYCLMRFLVVPMRNVARTIFRERDRGLRSVVIILVANYALYFFIMEHEAVNYLFLLNVIPGFDYAAYSGTQFVRTAFSSAFLLVFLPALRLRLHETALLSAVSAATAVGFLATAFVSRLWHYYSAQALTFAAVSWYTCSRACMSRCVAEAEVGAAFSAMSLMGAVVPLVANPAFRQLYDRTLESFPGAYFLLAAAATVLTVAINLFVFSRRRQMEGENVDTSK